MDEIRTLIQTRLNSISSVNSGVPIPDGLVEEGTTYFGYELQENFISNDFDNNYFMEVALTGRLVRKNDPTENTLQIMDIALESIKEALKGLNFKYSYRDVSEYQDGYKKGIVTARMRYLDNNKMILK